MYKGKGKMFFLKNELTYPIKIKYFLPLLLLNPCMFWLPSIKQCYVAWQATFSVAAPLYLCMPPEIWVGLMLLLSIRM